MCLLGFWQVWGLCTLLLLLSSIRHFFFMQQNHIGVLIFQSKFSLSSVSSYLNTTTSILKHLSYSRVLDKYRCDTSSAKFEQKAHWNGHSSILRIYTRPGGSHFVLKSLASFQWIKNKTKHLLWQGLNQAACSREFAWQQSRLTPPNTAVTLIEQLHNTRCIATCHNWKTKQTSVLKL